MFFDGIVLAVHSAPGMEKLISTIFDIFIIRKFLLSAFSGKTNANPAASEACFSSMPVQGFGIPAIKPLFFSLKSLIAPQPASITEKREIHAVYEIIFFIKVFS